MGEHQIRLRAAWSWRSGPDEVEAPRRVDLPASWEGFGPDRFWLARRFGSPPVDPRFERLGLEFRSVPGLISARLNGRELIGNGDDRRDWSVALEEPLPARNELVLEVDLGATKLGTAGEPWGEISLVIAPKGHHRG